METTMNATPVTVKAKDFKKLMTFNKAKVTAIDGKTLAFNAMLQVSRTGNGYVFNREKNYAHRPLFTSKTNIGKWSNITVDFSSPISNATLISEVNKEVTKLKRGPRSNHAVKIVRSCCNTTSEQFAIEEVKQMLLTKALESIKKSLA